MRSMLFSSVFWLTTSGRAPPGRQGSADFYSVRTKQTDATISFLLEKLNRRVSMACASDCP